jgi:hypothetical protein
MAADVTPFAGLVPHNMRAGWDALATMMVMALATFWEVLPHLIQLGGGMIVLLTIWEKPTVQALVARRRARKTKEDTDAIGR